MGILGSSYSFSSFWARVPDSVEDREKWVLDRLQRYAFKDDVEGISKRFGWVTAFEPYASQFNMDLVMMGEFALFSMRIDEKKVPKALIKKYLAIEEAKYMEEKGIKRVPRAARKRLKEKVEVTLMKRTLPVPCIYDVAWDLDAGEVYFFHTSSRVIGEFQEFFKRTFDLMPVPVVPYTLACRAFGREAVRVLDAELLA